MKTISKSGQQCAMDICSGLNSKKYKRRSMRKDVTQDPRIEPTLEQNEATTGYALALEQGLSGSLLQRKSA